MGSKKRFREKQKAKRTAKKKIDTLFDKAAAEPRQDVADRIVRKGRRLAMKFRMSLGAHREEFCKHCYARLKPGVNARVRLHKGKRVIYCESCKKYRRVPYKK